MATFKQVIISSGPGRWKVYFSEANIFDGWHKLKGLVENLRGNTFSQRWGIHLKQLQQKDSKDVADPPSWSKSDVHFFDVDFPWIPLISSKPIHSCNREKRP